MADPDVEHAGDAVGRTGSAFDRRRNPLLLIIGVVLLVGGVAAMAVGIFRLATEAGPSESRALVEGKVAALGAGPGPDLYFDHTGDVTVWIKVPANEVEADTRVAGTICSLGGPVEEAGVVRGNRQGSAVTIGDWSTVGQAETIGRTAISCGSFPYGPVANHDRLRTEPEYLVEPGTPGDGLRGLWLLIPGIVAAICSIPILIRWRSGTLKRRR